MKITVMGLLGLALFTACSQNVTLDPRREPPPNTDIIPDVPRIVQASFNCSSVKQPISGDLPGNPRDTGNSISLMRAQVTPSVWNLLYTSKTLLNTYYFGYSNADLDTLHQAAYQNFKKTHPDALSTYSVTNKVDPLMDTYVAPIAEEDQHTYYLNAENVAYMDSVRNNTTPSSPVFGLSSAPVPSGDGVVITDVRGDGPAYAAGLRRGDVLLNLNGQALNRTVQASGNDDTEQRQLYAKVLSDAAARRTPVTFSVRRGMSARQIILTGEKLGAARLPWQETLKDADGQTYMYLRLPTFEAAGAGAKVHELVAQANAQGMKGIIVDLRNNGGGLLTEYVAAVAAFVPNLAGETVNFVDGSSSTFRYSSGTVLRESSCKSPATVLRLPKPAEWNGKVAVLTNAGSASGSEMFSVNIRQGGKAILIGEKTYGVGNTSTFIFDLPGGRGLSVTSGRVFINGEQASETVHPDMPVKDDLAALAAQGTDAAVQAAMTKLSK